MTEHSKECSGKQSSKNQTTPLPSGTKPVKVKLEKSLGSLPVGSRIKVEALLEKEPSITRRAISNRLGISMSTVTRCYPEHLKKRKGRPLTKAMAKWIQSGAIRSSVPRFNQFLKNLKSADKYCNEGSVKFLYESLIPHRRKQFFNRLKEVDPEGLAEIRKIKRAGTYNKKREKRLIKSVAKKERDRLIKEGAIAMAQEHWESTGITKLRFVQPREILNVIATMMAAGYSRDEVREKLEVEMELIKMVTPSMVTSMRKKFQEGIVMAADQKVYKDMMEGTVDVTTERADRIAGRRRKLVLDVMKTATPKGGGLLPSEIEEKEKALEARFGVKRKIIDVTPEIEKEKTDEGI